MISFMGLVGLRDQLKNSFLEINLIFLINHVQVCFK